MHPFKLFNPFLKHVFRSLRPFFCFSLFLHLLYLTIIGVSSQLFFDALELLLKKVISLLLVNFCFCFIRHFVF